MAHASGLGQKSAIEKLPLQILCTHLSEYGIHVVQDDEPTRLQTSLSVIQHNSAEIRLSFKYQENATGQAAVDITHGTVDMQ